MAGMTGKDVLVTGGTNGIGKQVATELARLGAQVFVAGRDQGKIDATVNEVAAATGNTSVVGLKADLSTLAGVRKLTSDYRARSSRLDVLVNNAGALHTDRVLTSDGIERTFALNHLAYFELTRSLEDLLRASAPSRVINVASGLHAKGEIHWEDVGLASGYAPLKAYAQSKLANVMFSFEMADRLSGSGVTVNAMHPGMVASGFGKNNPGLVGRVTALVLGIAQRLFGVDARQGADTVIYLATAAEVHCVTGKYFHRRQAVDASAGAQDKTDRRRLWALSEGLIAAAGRGA